MHRAPPALRLLAASLASCLGLASAAAAQGEAGDLLVARPRADAELADVAAGHEAWLHDKLARANLGVIAPSRSQDPGASGLPAIAALRELARAGGATLLVLPELRLRDSALHVRLALYAVETGALLAAPHAMAPLATPGSACEDTAARLLERLGVPASAMPAATPPLLDELAASGRALHQLEAGDFARAWREVEGKLSPTAMRLREDITARAGRAETPLVERARVLAVTGDGAGAWTLLAPELARGPEAPPPDPRLLLAAAQAQLARGDPRAARPHLDQLLATRPDDAELQLELGRFWMLQNDRDAARAALTRSAELDTSSPLPFVLLAELDAVDPERQAQHLLAAGRREAARFNTQRAENYFERAIELAPDAEKPTLRAIGVMNQRIGRAAEALAAFDAAREAGDSDAEVFAGLGVAQRRLGQTEAETSLRRALSLEPDRADALRELAQIYTESGRTKDAVGLLERAVALEPERPETRRALARALHANGDPARALSALAGPDAAGAGSAASLGAVAAIHREQGDLPAARAELLRAV
jgi:tetratricopeptide (TPR) repeat protein